MSLSHSLRTNRAYHVLVTNNSLIFIQSIIVLVIVWSIISNIFGLQDTISTPGLVGEEFLALILSMEWVSHLQVTILRVFYAFVATIIIGTFLGVLMGASDFWKVALQDYITAGLAFPSLFAAVFAAIWFGFSPLTPMFAGAFIAFPFLTQNVYKGVDGIDYRLIEMSDAFDVSKRSVIQRVIVKSVLPEWFSGVRYSLALCWKVVTLAELVAASDGIGYMIQVQLNVRSLTGVIVWTLVFTTVMLVVEYGILRPIEIRLFAWRKDVSIGWA